MQDRPTAQELLEAVRLFLEEEVAPLQNDHRRRFRTLVAISAIATVERELQSETAFVRDEVKELSILLERPAENSHEFSRVREIALELNGELARLIRSGNPPMGTIKHLRRVGRAKLEIASPAYLQRHDENQEGR